MTKEKLEALENQLDRMNKTADPLRYQRQERLVRKARQELAVDKVALTFGDLVRKHG